MLIYIQGVYSSERSPEMLVVPNFKIKPNQRETSEIIFEWYKLFTQSFLNSDRPTSHLNGPIKTRSNMFFTFICPI